MKIVKMKLSELHPAERNIRMHPPEQIKEYIRSIEKFGQTKPIVIDEDNNILIGNGLYQAISEMGGKEAECFKKTGLSENEKKKLMMSDNKIFDLGTDDLSTFDDFIKELDGDFDIPGYSDDLLNSLIADNDETTETLTKYGIVTEEEAEKIREEGNKPAARTDDEQESGTETARVSPPSYSYEDTEDDSGNVTPTRKFVVCPHCGEKVWL